MYLLTGCVFNCTLLIMKNLLISSLFLISLVANAAWKITPVQSKEQAVGYIYSIDAEGTPKSFTSLRFICSTKGGEPIIALLWAKGINTEQNVSVDITIDNKITYTGTSWKRDEMLLYRTISESTDLITSMKNSHNIKFQWKGLHSEKYTTGFIVTGFDLIDFNTKCKL